eukprot:462261_1
MVHFVVLYLLAIVSCIQSADPVEQLVEEIFPHHSFDCDPSFEVFETEFSFLDGLARGFVHVERHRIFFEYYFPAEHWVGFSTADQSIEGEEDGCSSCYYSHYYPLEASVNRSNLYPQCIEECLEDTIFVATVNSDEENLNNWNIIEFQIIAQESKKLEQKMYRIPPQDEILEIWGSSYSPYRRDAHFETSIYKIDSKEFIHARFWRKYDFSPHSDFDEYDSSNEWQVFVSTNDDLYYPDSLCFISIGSFYGGEYPYDDDALQGLLPGFYIDTKHLANIHCYKLDDIKVDCGQDWSWMTLTKEEEEQQQEEENTTDDTNEVFEDSDSDTNDDTSDTDTEITPDEMWSDGDDFDTLDTEYDADIALDIETTITDTSTSSSTTTTQSTSSSVAASVQPNHGEDCCSAISGISYDDIDCLNISKSSDWMVNLEEKWKSKQCGRTDKLPTDLSEGIAGSDCDHLWALFNQIHEICYQFSFTKNQMKIYNHFKTVGGYECFGRNSDECKAKEEEIDANNTAVFLEGTTQEVEGKESELAEMEEDGGLTITSLGILGLIIVFLTLYVLYWFFCSAASKGYRQSSQFMNGAYYEDDIDTDDMYYNQRRQMQGYNKYNGNENDNDSDWSEDEQLGVDKKKKKKQYDVSVNDIHSMPVDEDNANDAVEINVNDDEDEEDDYYYDDDAQQNMTLQPQQQEE